MIEKLVFDTYEKLLSAQIFTKSAVTIKTWFIKVFQLTNFVKILSALLILWAFEPILNYLKIFSAIHKF